MDEDWTVLVSFLPPGWRELARHTRALKGLRKDKSPEKLLVFKRFKSLAQLGRLPKHDDESAKAWLYGKLLVALLVEKLTHHAVAVSPWGYDLETTSTAQRMAWVQVRPQPSLTGHRTPNCGSPKRCRRVSRPWDSPRSGAARCAPAKTSN